MGAPKKTEEQSEEEKLVKLHSSLIEFYHKHKPENLDNDVLIILMQFYIDNGAEKFNGKLMKTYGEDLNTFTPAGQEKKKGFGKKKRTDAEKKAAIEKKKAAIEKKKAAKAEKKRRASKKKRGTQAGKKNAETLPGPPPDMPPLPEPETTVEDNSRQSSSRSVSSRVTARQKQVDEFYDRSLPPLPKDPTTTEAISDTLRVSKRFNDVDNAPTPKEKPKFNRGAKPKFGNKPKKVKVNIDTVKKELEDSDPFDTYFDPDENPEHRLEILDKHEKPKLTPRDLIEAFYSVYDVSKLDAYATIEKFVLFVKQNNLEQLSVKLREKYGKGLDDKAIKHLARRRKVLESLLTEFYENYDPAKLKTRWAVLKIVNWTMEKGLPKLNQKFEQRYGHTPVPFK